MLIFVHSFLRLEQSIFIFLGQRAFSVQSESNQKFKCRAIKLKGWDGRNVCESGDRQATE